MMCSASALIPALIDARERQGISTINKERPKRTTGACVTCRHLALLC